MIKRVIFDLDNTLIDWKDDYWNKAIEEVCLQFKIENSLEVYKKIIKVVNDYEKSEEYFNTDIMQQLINKELQKDYSTDFIKMILKYFEKCVPETVDEKVIKTLEYLKDKYELVVLTNWFEEQQKERLKNVNIYKYFKHVYCTENIKMKPNKEAFEISIGEYFPSECVMIGDNLRIDIDGALNAGLNAIFLNRNNIKVDKKYKVINSIEELIEIL